MEEAVGWVWTVRDMGKIVFILIRKYPENIVEQLVLKKGETEEESLELARKLYPETLVKAFGQWIESKKYATGREFKVKKLELIAPSQPTPFDLTGKTPADYSTRIKYRYLDIRRPKVAAIFRGRDIIVNAARAYLKKQGFTEIWPPIIIATATEGGAELFPIVYFEREAFLAQSGQLYKQAAVPAFGKVFAIAPSFRAEKSRTRKHLTEFWQIDVELAFADRETLMELEFGIYTAAAEALIEESKVLEMLNRELDVPEKYEKVSYEEALEILQKKGFDLSWGDDFGAPEERALCAEFDVPFFITEFPKDVCAFYYRLDDKDPRYAQKMDFMSPGEDGLELSSGGPREHRPEVLIKRLKEQGMKPESFSWYIDMFKYGFPPHGGFGIGVERLTLALLGLEKVTEAALFPRTPDILEP